MSISAKARVVVAPSGVVNVHVKPETLYSLEAIQSLLPHILGPLGCQACCSGRQLIFQQEESEFQI